MAKWGKAGSLLSPPLCWLQPAAALDSHLILLLCFKKVKQSEARPGLHRVQGGNPSAFLPPDTGQIIQGEIDGSTLNGGELCYE